MGAGRQVDSVLAHPDGRQFRQHRAHRTAYLCRGRCQWQALSSTKNHMVVMSDADLDKTAAALMSVAGSRCMAITIAMSGGWIGSVFPDRQGKGGEAGANPALPHSLRLPPFGLAVH